ncbi:hypothetical protein JB92DRAFT_3138150 [Gautieria morchelliformis]|nr:hypothetical protein JB92DRAFT_3138150 [Gautieria morchelliformis]
MSAYDDRYVRSGVVRGPSPSAPYDPSDVPAREGPLDKTRRILGASPYSTEPDAEGGVRASCSSSGSPITTCAIPLLNWSRSPSLLPFSEGLLSKLPLSRVQRCGTPSAKTFSEPDVVVQQLVSLHPEHYDLPSHPASPLHSPHDATVRLSPYVRIIPRWTDPVSIKCHLVHGTPTLHAPRGIT